MKYKQKNKKTMVQLSPTRSQEIIPVKCKQKYHFTWLSD